MKRLIRLRKALIGAAIALLPLPALAGETLVVSGGGQSGFGADLDNDGDLDGSYFGIGAMLQDNTVTGHFVCAMWGHTDILELPLMAVEGELTSAVLPAHTESILFSGVGTVDLGKGRGELMKGVKFRVRVTPGGPGQGRIQLTVIGSFDGLLGDTILGNGDCDMPIETLAGGQIESYALAPAAPLPDEGARQLLGGGQTTFGTDLDGDGNIDGAYFGVGMVAQGTQVQGHFVCAMWGNTEYLGLPLMGVEGQITRAVFSDAKVVSFSGVGTVDLGKRPDGFFTEVPFEVVLKAGGPGEGKLQLTVIGVFDGIPGDVTVGNGNCDLPIETITSGLVESRFVEPMVTAVEEEMARTPAAFALQQNYPNPFNPQTTIHYEVPAEAEIRLSILDLAGQQVRLLVEGPYQPGQYSAVWDGTDASGRAVASGVYVYRLEVVGQGVVETKRMVLVR